jgi:hypothetical protein
MSDQIAIDLFIQDFVNTNKLLNQHWTWEQIVNRRYVEDGRIRVFSFVSSGTEHLAVGQMLSLPDADWFRIELTRAIPPVEEHRFDILKLLQQRTHTGLAVDISTASTVLVKLTTRHRGLANILFVVRDVPALTNPFLV